jgi:hypothetical protein
LVPPPVNLKNRSVDQFHGGKKVAIDQSGIDPDFVGHVKHHIRERGMAKNHCFPHVMLNGDEIASNPHEVMRLLLLQSQSGIDARMHEEKLPY